MNTHDAKIITISNQKGGVGKTTSSVNIASYLAASEIPTLIIDMDPQANTTSGLGLELNSSTKSIYDLIIKESGAKSVIQKTDLEYLPLSVLTKKIIIHCMNEK